MNSLRSYSVGTYRVNGYAAGKGRGPASVVIPKFASYLEQAIGDLRNQADTSQHNDSSVALVLKSVSESAPDNVTNFKTATLARKRFGPLALNFAGAV